MSKLYIYAHSDDFILFYTFYCLTKIGSPCILSPYIFSAFRPRRANMTSGKMEFAVEMTCDDCVSQIKKSLQGIGNVDINIDKNVVVVHSDVPWSVIQQKIESTGRRAVLLGFGGSSAVAMMSGNDIQGVVRFAQIPPPDSGCIVDGVLDGLQPGVHGLHVHECGDISQGCESVGDHYNPHNAPHGCPDSDIKHRHIGDLGNISANETGRAGFRFVDHLLEVSDVIGRSLVVTEKEDDFGKSGLQDGNSGLRLACGIIARSAGLFQNYKKICACDGVTLWDERERPLAGHGRNSKTKDESDTKSNL